MEFLAAGVAPGAHATGLAVALDTTLAPGIVRGDHQDSQPVHLRLRFRSSTATGRAPKETVFSGVK